MRAVTVFLLLRPNFLEHVDPTCPLCVRACFLFTGERVPSGAERPEFFGFVLLALPFICPPLPPEDPRIQFPVTT